MLRKMAVALILSAAFGAAAYAYDIKVSRLNSWELGFSSRPPRVMEMRENSSMVVYTYIVYEVKNDTPQDIDFFPSVEIESGSGKVYLSGVYPDVEREVAARFGSGVLGFSAVKGTIKAGESRKGVAVFKDVDASAEKLTLYVGGLSGDFKMDKNAEGKIVTMYRTYKAVYFRPGDAWHLQIDPVTLKGTEWVWRE